MRLLREWLRLGVWPSEATVSGQRRPMGFQQLTLSGGAVGLTIPAGPAGAAIIASFALIQCTGTSASASWRDDGVDPTASIGMLLSTGDAPLQYFGDLTAIRFITGAGSPVLNVSYYA